MELENIILSEVTDSERQIRYVLTHRWILGVNYRINNLPSTAPKRLDKKEGPKEDEWISL